MGITGVNVDPTTGALLGGAGMLGTALEATPLAPLGPVLQSLPLLFGHSNSGGTNVSQQLGPFTNSFNPTATAESSLTLNNSLNPRANAVQISLPNVPGFATIPMAQSLPPMNLPRQTMQAPFQMQQGGPTMNALGQQLPPVQGFMPIPMAANMSASPIQPQQIQQGVQGGLPPLQGGVQQNVPYMPGGGFGGMPAMPPRIPLNLAGTSNAMPQGTIGSLPGGGTPGYATDVLGGTAPPGLPQLQTIRPSMDTSGGTPLNIPALKAPGRGAAIQGGVGGAVAPTDELTTEVINQAQQIGGEALRIPGDVAQQQQQYTQDTNNYYQPLINAAKTKLDTATTKQATLSGHAAAMGGGGTAGNIQASNQYMDVWNELFSQADRFTKYVMSKNPPANVPQGHPILKAIGKNLLQRVTPKKVLLAQAAYGIGTRMAETHQAELEKQVRKNFEDAVEHQLDREERYIGHAGTMMNAEVNQANDNYNNLVKARDQNLQNGLQEITKLGSQALIAYQTALSSGNDQSQAYARAQNTLIEGTNAVSNRMKANAALSQAGTAAARETREAANQPIVNAVRGSEIERNKAIAESMHQTRINHQLDAMDKANNQNLPKVPFRLQYALDMNLLPKQYTKQQYTQLVNLLDAGKTTEDEIRKYGIDPVLLRSLFEQ